MNDPQGRQGLIPIFIGLGSNLGDIRRNLAQAVDSLSGLQGVEEICCSRLYYTEPQGVKDQPWFGNQVVRLFCSPDAWSPLSLLQRLLDIEDRMGRVRTQRWGQRIMDLDLLLFGDSEMESPRLTLPHPLIRERAFVLVPLLEMEPGLCLPDGESLADCLARLDYRLEGELIRQE